MVWPWVVGCQCMFITSRLQHKFQINMYIYCFNLVKIIVKLYSAICIVILNHIYFFNIMVLMKKIYISNKKKKATVRQMVAFCVVSFFISRTPNQIQKAFEMKNYLNGGRKMNCIKNTL